MIDLHLHTVLSDGALIPAELARRAEAKGCRFIAITDHVDHHNVEQVTEAIVRFSEDDAHAVKVIPGVEITHVTPGKIADVAKLARNGGAKLILVHGETIMEPVESGTNEAAIDAGADILAHPGLIEPLVVQKAMAAGMRLEISGRKGHGFTNGHLVKVALEAGAQLIFNSDAHAPEDLLDRAQAIRIMIGAGLTPEKVEEIMESSQKLAEERVGTV